MNPFNWFKKAQPKARIDSHELAKMLASKLGTAAGVDVGITDAMRVGAVYRCANVASDIVAMAPIHIKDKVTREKRAFDDDLVYILNDRPNHHIDSFTFRKTMELHRIFRGRACAQIIRSRGRIIGLELMSPNATTVVENADRSLTFRYTTPSGKQIELQQKDVIHVLGPSFDGVTGMSTLEAAKNQIGLSLASESHSSNLFRRGTHIGDTISFKTPLTDEQWKRLADDIQEFRDPDSNKGTLILENDGTYNRIGMTQADAEFVIGRKLGIVEICMFFGIPPHIIGYTENQTSYGQGVEHQGIAFRNFNVAPMFRAHESAYAFSLLNGNRREFIDFDDKFLMKGDTKATWDKYKIGREIGYYDTDDIAELEGEPVRKEGGDYWSQPNKAKETE